MAKRPTKPAPGWKQCPACKNFNAVRSRVCETKRCGHVFQKKEAGQKAGDRTANALAELVDHLRGYEKVTLDSYIESREVDLNELVKSGASQKTIERAVEQVKNQYDWTVLTNKEFATLCSVLKKMI
jgi:hypothetical protein